MTKEFRYDTIRYPSYVFRHFRPDIISAMAVLHGVRPRSVSGCRVLELGCGDGASLLSIATSMPASTCVGIDLSKDRIEEANEAAGRIGVPNIEFHNMDVMDFDPDRLGEFDFIVAHGLYSWVPPAVREKVLWIYERSLAPQGVGYISYNAFPGWHLRQIVRDACRFAGAGSNGSVEDAERALEFVRLAAAGAQTDSVYGEVLVAELKHEEGRPLEVVFHDELSDFNQPLYFSEFAAQLDSAGLAFLAESDPFMHFTGKFGKEARGLLDSLMEDPLRREQAMDFLRGTRFRGTLVCRPEVQRSYSADASALDGLYFSSTSGPVDPTSDLLDDSVVEFSAPKDSTFSTNFGFTKSFLGSLSSAHPRRVSFNDVKTALSDRFAHLEDFEGKFEIFRQHVTGLYHAGVVELSGCSVDFFDALSERPAVSAFARWQVDRGFTYITTPTGHNIQLESETTARLVLALDGTRTLAEAHSKGVEDLGSNVNYPLEMAGEDAKHLCRLGVLVA